MATNREGGKFTSTYKCHYLLYYEEYNHINKAIKREKNLKNWHREWKLNLIKTENNEFLDLAANWWSRYGNNQYLGRYSLLLNEKKLTYTHWFHFI